jgi:hypothetical protein
MYFNTTTNQIQVYKDGAWEDVAVGSVSLTGQPLDENEIIVGNSSDSSVAVNTDLVGDIRVSSDLGAIVKDGVIDDANIASGAAIARSKIASGTQNVLIRNDGSGNLSEVAAITANRALISDSNGLPTASSVTSAEINYVSGVTSNIQDQIDAISISSSGYLKADGSVPFTADQDADGNTITNLSEPVGASDASTKNYVDTVAATKLSLSGGTMTGDIAMGGNSISGLAAPANANDAARKIDIDNALSGLDFQKDVDGVQVDATLSPSVTLGSRYIITNSASLNAGFGTITGLGNNDIVEYNGSTFVVAYDVSAQGSGALVWDKSSLSYYRYNGTAWDEFGGLSGVNAGIGLSKSGNTLNVNLGAGISQLPSDEVGIDLYSSSGLMLTEDGTTNSTNTAAQLSLKLDGATLSKSVDGIKVATGGITNNEVNSAAAIDYSKLASLSTGAPKALVSDNSGHVSESTVTAAELEYLSGATSSIQTQLNDKANTTLSNLTSPTAINQNLRPDTQGGRSIGQVGSAWSNVFSYGYKAPAGTLATNITVNSGSSSVTVSNATGIIANSGILYHPTAFPNGATITAVAGLVLTVNSPAADTVSNSPGFATFGFYARTENETSSPSGEISLRSGNTTTGLTSGSATLRTGTSTTGKTGSTTVTTGASSAGGVTGNTIIGTGTSSANTGFITIATGNSSAATSGAINLTTGNSATERGTINLNSKTVNIVTENGIQIIDAINGAAIISTAVFTLNPSVGTPTIVHANMSSDASESKSQHIQYELVHTSSGETRTGTLMIAVGNVAAGSISLIDTYTSTSATMDTVEFSAILNTGTGEYNVYYVNPESVAFSIRVLTKRMLVSSL